MSEVLWSDLDLLSQAHQAFGEHIHTPNGISMADACYEKLKIVRDEMQARIAELEAQVGWEPVPDGIEYFEARGLAYSVLANGEGFAVGMEQGGGHFEWPANIRLCRRVEAQQGEAA